MDEAGRWEHLVALDEELLQGAVVLSEWCSVIIREADIAFVNGAHLATVLTAVSAIETYLRSECLSLQRMRLVELINLAGVGEELQRDLHTLRKYRNKWVHVEEPWSDEELLANTSTIERELESMAFFAVRTLRRTIYSFPGI